MGLNNAIIAFDLVSAQTLAQVAQGNCGCPISGSIQDLVEQGSEQPGQVEGVVGGLEQGDL